MTKQFNRIKGKEGEDIARKYLEEQGYKIIEMNHQTRFGEIDMVASQGDTLLFIEVKFKQTEDFGTPEEMIGKNKMTQIKRTAEMYLLNNPEIAKKYDRYQIDAVCIVGNGDKSIRRISHYENISM